MTVKFWDAIQTDRQRDHLWHQFPDIRPPDHRLDHLETRREMVYIMQEKPKGETAIIGKTPINIRSEVKKGAKNGKSKLA